MGAADARGPLLASPPPSVERVRSVRSLGP